MLAQPNQEECRDCQYKIMYCNLPNKHNENHIAHFVFLCPQLMKTRITAQTPKCSMSSTVKLFLKLLIKCQTQSTMMLTSMMKPRNLVGPTLLTTKKPLVKMHLMPLKPGMQISINKQNHIDINKYAKVPLNVPNEKPHCRCSYSVDWGNYFLVERNFRFQIFV